MIVGVWWIACRLWSAGWLFLKVGLADLPPLTFAERWSLARATALRLDVVGVMLVSRGRFDAGSLAGRGSAAVL